MATTSSKLSQTAATRQVLLPADIRKLAVPTWRGIMVPCRSFRHRFAQEQSPQHVKYAQGDFFDMTGSRARSWAATIAFNETLKDYDQLFSKTFPEFYKAYRDRSPGILVTPLQGPVLCVPGSYEDNVDPKVLDGISVDVVWSEHTPVAGSQLDAPPNLPALFTEAQALDTAVNGTSWDGSKPLPTADPLTAIAATINKLNTTRDKAKANVLAVSQRANAVETAFERLGSNGGPKCNAGRLAARKLRLRSERLANAPPRDAPGVVVEEVTSTPQTVFQLAREAGMDLKDFLDLNYSLARSATVPKGTNVWVVRK